MGVLCVPLPSLRDLRLFERALEAGRLWRSFGGNRIRLWVVVNGGGWRRVGERLASPVEGERAGGGAAREREASAAVVGARAREDL